MDNFIAALIILAFIVIFTGINSAVICGICDDMIALIDKGKTEEACELWKRRQSYIALFVRDAEIDCVNAEVDALGGMQSNEADAAKAETIRLREAVIELRDSEKPNFQDIMRIEKVDIA